MDSDKIQWHFIARLDEFGDDRKLVRDFFNQSILLYRREQEVLAVNNLCSHLDKSLEKGRIIGGKIICPHHGACFNLKTGKAVSGPAVSPLKTFPIQLKDGQVFIGEEIVVD